MWGVMKCVKVCSPVWKASALEMLAAGFFTCQSLDALGFLGQIKYGFDFSLSSSSLGPPGLLTGLLS